MSRFLSNDFINKDPRAKLTVAKLANIGDLVAPTAEYLTATGLTELTVTAGCVITIGSTGVFKTDATVLSTGNLDAGSVFTVGKDYYVYICDPGSEDLDEVYKISLNSTYPDGYDAETSRKIGGFHYGRVRQVSNKLIPINTAGVEKGSGWESNVASGIVPRSVWTTKHRPKCSPEGMVYAGGGLWVDIYIASSNGVGGVKSAYNATPLTGTEGHNSYDFIDLGLKSGKRLLSYSEWQQAAYGSPQGADGNNTNAWAATSNTARTTTGKVVNAVSAIGCVDCVGNVWEWLDELSYRYDGTQSWSWKDVLGAGNGQAYTEGTYGLVRLVAGGGWLRRRLRRVPRGELSRLPLDRLHERRGALRL